MPPGYRGLRRIRTMTPGTCEACSPPISGETRRTCSMPSTCTLPSPRTRSCPFLCRKSLSLFRNLPERRSKAAFFHLRFLWSFSLSMSDRSSSRQMSLGYNSTGNPLPISDTPSGDQVDPSLLMGGKWSSARGGSPAPLTPSATTHGFAHDAAKQSTRRCGHGSWCRYVQTITLVLSS